MILLTETFLNKFLKSIESIERCNLLYLVTANITFSLRCFYPSEKKHRISWVGRDQPTGINQSPASGPAQDHPKNQIITPLRTSKCLVLWALLWGTWFSAQPPSQWKTFSIPNLNLPWHSFIPFPQVPHAIGYLVTISWMMQKDICGKEYCCLVIYICLVSFLFCQYNRGINCPEKIFLVLFLIVCLIETGDASPIYGFNWYFYFFWTLPLRLMYYIISEILYILYRAPKCQMPNCS